MIAFQDVEVRYGDEAPAVSGVSLETSPGQFCVLLGPSGAGKSTLLRCVNGLVRPSAGEVRVAGEVVRPASLKRLRPTIGMIHQHFNLVPRASVAENVVCGALPAISTARALAGLFPAHYRRRACELVQAVGLGPEQLNKRVEALSGGQQQRVGIARAFMLSPKVILADEPVASLDPQTSEDILALLRRQARESGASVICSLHQVELARAFADRVIAMRRGRLVYDGPPQGLSVATLAEIYARPAGEPVRMAS